MMKIAIPSANGKTIAGHFGRTKGFQIIEIEDKKVIKEEYRENSFTGHAKGHHHDHDHHHSLSVADDHHQHSHKGILSGLHDCEVVIAKGMGRRLYDDLEKNGKTIFVTQESNIEKVVELYLSDKLDNQEEFCCSGH
jgi:predicted Fe-Mo cluster-binding NifX family protein